MPCAVARRRMLRGALLCWVAACESAEAQRAVAREREALREHVTRWLSK